MEIKICGLTRRCDAELALELGADYLGFVLVPGSPREVTPERLPELTRNLGGVKVGVFVDPEPEQVLRLVELGGLDIVQLHGSRRLPELETLRLWRALAGGGEPEFPAERYLADAGRPGSGQTTDWAWAAALARRYPVLLAGGICAANAAAAWQQVRPLGLDLAGGVESAPGIKSETKMREFFKVIRSLEA